VLSSASVLASPAPLPSKSKDAAAPPFPLPPSVRAVPTDALPPVDCCGACSCRSRGGVGAREAREDQDDQRQRECPEPARHQVTSTTFPTFSPACSRSCARRASANGTPISTIALTSPRSHPFITS